jgi:hypothetical protein
MININQMPLPKKLLVLTNQQEIKEQRQLEARKLNVSLISRKKKKALEQCDVGFDEGSQQAAQVQLCSASQGVGGQMLLDYLIDRQANKCKRDIDGVRGTMDWDYLIKIARDGGK